jgi:chemotaxis protein CheD
MASPRDVVLRPGDFCFGGDGLRIHTLLGSCVSITLWHPKRRIGGMCHYMVATRPRPEPPGALDGRYADEAMQMFLREVERHHTSPQEYEVKMFGGGNQFPDAGADAVLDVAGENIAAGIWLLAHHGFVVRTRQLGGTGSRRLIFDLATGTVWLNSLHRFVAGSPA